jgi:hypothetical protein
MPLFEFNELATSRRHSPGIAAEVVARFALARLNGPRLGRPPDRFTDWRWQPAIWTAWLSSEVTFRTWTSPMTLT